MKRIYCNDDWQFTTVFSEALLRPDFDASSLETVRLPHTCAETPLNYFDEHIYQMVCGYRKNLSAPETWQGQSILMTFEAVGHSCQVYVNGNPIQSHACGYTAFTVDLSQRLRFGQDNWIVLQVDTREDQNIPPFGFVIDYMTYGGIYRDVYLEIGHPIHLTDVFLTSHFEEAHAALSAEITLSAAGDGLTLRQQLIHPDGHRQELGSCPVSGTSCSFRWDAGNIDLWDTEHPTLYGVETQLLQKGQLLDSRIDRFGFRQAEFRQDGFYLNGKKIKIRGLNRHQSYPYVGYAMPASMQRLDADILKKELGVNAVRTSHYPQSQDFMDRCDELGLLVFTELPGWQHIGDRAWKAQAVENVREMVLQYRNHPSIILWGVRINESRDDDEFYTRTNAVAHALDPTRPTGGVRCIKKSSLLEDVYTYNDFVHEGDNPGCEPKAKVTSDQSKPYLISEYNGHMYPTKAFDDENHRLSHALRHATVLDAVAGQADIAGSFGWCMFDYNTHKDFGSGDRICYHGVMDMFRNPKLAAAVYAAQQEEHTVLEVSSSMDIGEHPACNWGDAFLFTNAPRVRMYKNGQLLKEYCREDACTSALAHGPIPLDDFVGTSLESEHLPKKQEILLKSVLNSYAKYGLAHMPKKDKRKALWLMLRYHMSWGEALVLYNNHVGDWGGAATVYRFEALDEEGNLLKAVTKEPAVSLSLRASVNSTTLQEVRGYDVAAIRIQAVDQNGNVLPYFFGPISLVAEGAVALIGPSLISLQGGMGGTYVKSLGKPGQGTLTLQCSQAAPVTIAFEVL